MQNARGPLGSARTGRGCRVANLISALDGDWEKIEKERRRQGARRRAQPKASRYRRVIVQQATRDSIRALMLIRAYRMRGHLHANLDPLGLEPARELGELDPRAYGFTDADFDRKIFLDRVLGLEFGTLAPDRGDPAADLLPDAWRRIHAHFRSRRRRPGFSCASRASTRRSRSPARASGRFCRSSSRPKVSKSSATSNSPEPSGSGSTAAKQ